MIVLPYRVAFADTDASGRIHWASVFRWVELAEHALLLRHGILDPRPFPRRSAEVSYLRALGCGDEVEIHLEVKGAGRTSVTYRWRIERDGEICVDGAHTVVHVGGDGLPTPWPTASTASPKRTD